MLEVFVIAFILAFWEWKSFFKLCILLSIVIFLINNNNLEVSKTFTDSVLIILLFITISAYIFSYLNNKKRV